MENEAHHRREDHDADGEHRYTRHLNGGELGEQWQRLDAQTAAIGDRSRLREILERHNIDPDVTIAGGLIDLGGNGTPATTSSMMQKLGLVLRLAMFPVEGGKNTTPYFRHPPSHQDWSS